MARVLTVSFRDEDAWIVDELKLYEKKYGSLSAVFVKMARLFLESDEAKMAMAPDWYVPGRDYSHLDEKTRGELKKFGYVDKPEVSP